MERGHVFFLPQDKHLLTTTDSLLAVEVMYISVYGATSNSLSSDQPQQPVISSTLYLSMYSGETLTENLILHCKTHLPTQLNST